VEEIIEIIDKVIDTARDAEDNFEWSSEESPYEKLLELARQELIDKIEKLIKIPA